MKSVSIFCLTLLIALEPNNMIKSCLPASKMQPVLSHWQVAILNSMTDSTLVVHYKSKDNDLGEHVINAGGNYNWSFKENLLQTTLFWCNFSSKHGQATGDVFFGQSNKVG